MAPPNGLQQDITTLKNEIQQSEIQQQELLNRLKDPTLSQQETLRTGAQLEELQSTILSAKYELHSSEQSAERGVLVQKAELLGKQIMQAKEVLQREGLSPVLKESLQNQIQVWQQQLDATVQQYQVLHHHTQTGMLRAHQAVGVEKKNLQALQEQQEIMMVIKDIDFSDRLGDKSKIMNDFVESSLKDLSSRMEATSQTIATAEAKITRAFSCNDERIYSNCC